MARSVGEAAALGLESGFRLATDFSRQKREEERQARLDAQNAEGLQYTRSRQQEADRRAGLQGLAQLHKTEGQGYVDGGQKPSQEVMRDYAARGRAISGALTEDLQKSAGIDIPKRQQFGADGIKRLSAGDVQGLAPGQFTAAINESTGHPSSYFIDGPNGEPAPIKQAMAKISQGLANNDEASTLDGLNAAYGPRLDVGLGEESPHGGVILGKQFIKLVDDPRAPKDDPRVVPVVRVWVGSGTENFNGPSIPGAPQGTTGYYDAPITKGRSTRPDDPPISIRVHAAMDNLDNHLQLADLLNSPEGRAKLEQDQKAAPNVEGEFFRALAQQGVKAPKNKTELKLVPEGVTPTLVTTDPNGNFVGTKSLPATPKTAKGGGSTQQFIDSMRALVASKDLDHETADSLIAARIKKDATRAESVGLAQPPQDSQAARFDVGDPVSARRQLVEAGDKEGLAAFDKQFPDVAAGKPTGNVGRKLAAQSAKFNGITEANKDLRGEELLATLTPQVAADVRSILAGNNPKGFSNKGNYQGTLEGLAKLAKEDYDSKRYPTAAATEKAFATGVESRKVRAFNVALEHIDTVRKLGEALDNGNVQLFNELANAIAEQTGKPAPTNFDAAKQILADEVVSGVVGATGAVSDREEAARNIRRASSPAQLNGVFDVFEELLSGQLKGLRQQYKAGGGSKDFDKDFFTPRAREIIGKSKQSDAASPKAPTQIKDAAGYNAIPSGAEYLDPNGVKRRKP